MASALFNGIIMNKPRRYLLSGDRQIGKTTLLLKLIDRADNLGVNVRGVISPAVFENGQKIGIDLLNVKTKQLSRLADLNPSNPTSDSVTVHWIFHPEILALGNTIFAHSVPCDLLVVDELGPLELERGQGWQNGLQAIQSEKYLTAVIVIRPELIESALNRWQDATILTLSKKDDEQQAALIETILAPFI